MSVEVRAPMPGSIVQILVKVGDRVKEEDELIILEAMKMENPVYAPAGGVVKAILVREKEVVEVDRVLLILE